MKKKTYLLITFISLILAQSCSTVSLTGRKQLHLMSDRAVESQAAIGYRKLIAESKISDNAQLTQLVNRVTIRLIDATRTYYQMLGMEQEFSRFKWEVHVIEKNVFNAFCMAGGKMAVYTGLFGIIETEDELAAIMGHEIAHATNKHINERMSQQLLIDLGAIALNSVMYNESPYNQEMASEMYQTLTQLGMLLPFNRANELEADKVGLELMTIAGYDPQGAVRCWEHVLEKMGGKPHAFFSTHPTEERRIRDLQAAIPGAIAFAATCRQQKNRNMLTMPEKSPTIALQQAREAEIKNAEKVISIDSYTSALSPTLSTVKKPASNKITYKLQLKIIPANSTPLAVANGLEQFGPVTTELTVIERKPYQRLLIAEFDNEKKAAAALEEAIHQGYTDANIFEYINGERNQIVNVVESNFKTKR